MRVRRAGFALIIVLLAVATVFALAMQGAAAARSARFETHILQQRLESSRTARSAVVLAIAGALSEGEGHRAGSDSAFGDHGDGAENEPPPDRELPEIVRALLGDRARELEDAADEQFEEDDKSRRLAEGGGFGSLGAGHTRYKRLEMESFPTAPIDIRISEAGPVHRVWLQDAASLLNVNAAPQDQIVRYLNGKGITSPRAEEVAEQIIDWRDEDSFVQPRGAEREQYVLRAVRPRNNQIESIEELLYLPAMDRDTFELIAPDLALDGDGTIHAGTAPPAVLLSVPGITQETVRRIVQLRSRGVLDDEALDGALPLAAREARDILRTKPSNIILVRVAVEGEIRRRFEGVAILRERGIANLAIRPTHRTWHTTAVEQPFEDATREAG